MIRLSAKATIGDFKFSAIAGCEIESGWDQLTDTAVITMPRRLSWKGKNIVLGKDPVLKKGDQVTIDLGYNDNNDRAFTGYVTAVKATIPAQIICEDSMWLLKQSTFTKTYSSVTLKQLLTDLLLSSSLNFEAPDVNLGPFRISKATPAQVLKKLKSDYMLKSFFRDGKLYCGLAYWPELQSEHYLRFDTHIIDNNLEYVRAEDVKIKLKVIVIDKQNQKTEYEFGDEDGEQRTLHFYDIEEDEVNHIATQEIDRLRYDGYRGGVTTFGQPFVRHGDVVNLFDSFFPDRSGRYLVKQSNPSYGMGGYRQQIELDSKI